MPSAGELPESLRPLTRRNALELENQRWEYDVGRLVRAVEQLVDATAAVRGPQPGADTRPIRSTETGTPVKETKKPSRSRRMSLAGLGVLVVVTAVVVFLLRPSGPMSVSAAHAVAAVPSDRLAGLLVETSFDSKDLPANVSASSPVLSSYRTPGLVDNVFVPFLGPAFDLSLHYMVFDSSAIASSFYANVAPLPEGYASTGQFHATGITDPTRCDTGREGAPALLAATWESSCRGAQRECRQLRGGRQPDEQHSGRRAIWRQP